MFEYEGVIEVKFTGFVVLSSVCLKMLTPCKHRRSFEELFVPCQVDVVKYKHIHQLVLDPASSNM